MPEPEPLVHETTVALRGRPTGLVRFEVRGLSAGRPARAVWDGRTLRMDGVMHDAATLCMAVEAIFAEHGSRRRAPSFSDSPMAVAVELVRSLDRVQRIEYTSRCPSGERRRCWVAPPDGGAGRD